jgi:acyl carrier protein
MDTRSAIRAFLCENFYVAEPEALADDASLLEAGIIDSTGVLEVVAFLEEKFGVEVADDDLTPENLDTVDRLVEFVERRMAGTAGGGS